MATYFGGTLPSDPFFENNQDLLLLQEALLEVLSDEEPIDYGESPIDVGASGTALRFLTAVCASSPGADYVITGTPRLMKRPMHPLIDVLRQAGATIQNLGNNEDGPYRVAGKALEGGHFFIRGDVSSQFLSALMLVAPSWANGMKLSFTTPLVSEPYVRMTARIMDTFGIRLSLTDMEVRVKPGKYKMPKDFTIESDWSSAAFFYEAVSLGVTKVEFQGLLSPDNSLQGDSVAADIFTGIGVDTLFDESKVTLTCSDKFSDKLEINFRNCPDLFLPVALACLCHDVSFHFSGISHLRTKESDRIASLLEESRKLGYVIKVLDDSVEWDGEKTDYETIPVIETHEDHRVAMAFAMTALKIGEVHIENPEVVEKSFANFWQQLPKIGLSCTMENNVMIVKK